jgi:hypothetical protein
MDETFLIVVASCFGLLFACWLFHDQAVRVNLPVQRFDQSKWSWILAPQTQQRALLSLRFHGLAVKLDGLLLNVLSREGLPACLPTWQLPQIPSPGPRICRSWSDDSLEALEFLSFNDSQWCLLRRRDSFAVLANVKDWKKSPSGYGYVDSLAANGHHGDFSRPRTVLRWELHSKSRSANLGTPWAHALEPAEDSCSCVLVVPTKSDFCYGPYGNFSGFGACLWLLGQQSAQFIGFVQSSGGRVTRSLLMDGRLILLADEDEADDLAKSIVCNMDSIRAEARLVDDDAMETPGGENYLPIVESHHLMQLRDLLPPDFKHLKIEQVQGCDLVLAVLGLNESQQIAVGAVRCDSKVVANESDGLVWTRFENFLSGP